MCLLGALTVVQNQQEESLARTVDSSKVPIASHGSSEPTTCMARGWGDQQHQRLSHPECCLGGRPCAYLVLAGLHCFYQIQYRTRLGVVRKGASCYMKLSVRPAGYINNKSLGSCGQGAYL